MIRLLAYPLPPPPPVNNLSLFLSLPVCRWWSLLTGKGKRGWAMSQIILQQESLALYKTFNTSWYWLLSVGR